MTIISIQFSDEELEAVDSAIAALNRVLEGKAVNLSPEERRQYGSIADRNKTLVDKVKFYMEKAPQTFPPLNGTGCSCVLKAMIL